MRVLGGDGNDTVDDSKSGGLDVQDPHGITVRRGPGTDVSEHEWKNPAPEPERPWLEPRNYGHWTVPMVQLWWEPNQALMLGGGFTRTAWGFHKYPWANMQSFTLLYSTGYKNVRATLPAASGGSATRAWSARVDRALLGHREPELLRLRQRDGADRRQDPVQDGDERVLDPSGPALPAEHPPSSCTSGPEVKFLQTKGGDSPSSSSSRTGRGSSARWACEPASSTTRAGRAVSMTEARGMAAPDATAARRRPRPAACGSGPRLLRAEGLGRDRELRRPRRQHRRLPREPEARVRDPRRRPRAVGPLPLVRVGQHLGRPGASPAPAASAATTTAASGATPPSTATRSCAAGSAAGRRPSCRCAGG